MTLYWLLVFIVKRNLVSKLKATAINKQEVLSFPLV